jgi:hypothetical protein
MMRVVTLRKRWILGTCKSAVTRRAIQSVRYDDGVFLIGFMLIDPGHLLPQAECHFIG